MKIKLDNLSLNTVLVFAAVAGVIYIGWKAKNAVSGVVDSIANADLNPFDQGSFIPELFNDVTGSISDMIESAGTNPYAVSARAAGIDITQYKPWFGGRGATRPANAVYLKQGRTGSWFVPK